MFDEYLQKFNEFGIVSEVRNHSVIVIGLPNISIDELVIFESGEFGQVFVINKDQVIILILSSAPIQPGIKVARTGSYVSTKVSNNTLGRIINPFGEELDSKETVKDTEVRFIDADAVDLSKREKITQPLITGTSLIDIMIPLGKGQRELILGDRKTGKSSFLFTTLKNQVKEGNIGIYALVGKRRSDLDKLYEFCIKENILENTIIIASFADDPASVIFQAPYAALTMAEFFRDQGRDSLVIIDDLSTHAKFYREITLLSNIFPGRESYPGDIFFAHSKLLERAGNFKTENGSVSITCLPVGETIESDLSSYIATNLMGMTDGHIYFDINSYNQGRRPAVNIQLSVTRVGKQTQTKLKKELNTWLNKFLVDYKKMENFSHFGAELSEDFTDTILTGERIYAFFGQNYKDAIPENCQLILLAFIINRDLYIQSKKNIPLLRAKLSESYHENREYYDQLITGKSMEEYTAAVKFARNEILKLCNLS